MTEPERPHSEQPGAAPGLSRSPHRTPEAAARLRGRQRAEWLFRNTGLVAIAIGLSLVILLFGSIAKQGWQALAQTEVRLEIAFIPSSLGVPG